MKCTHGESKVSLLAELSAADAIPKEYLINVAQALQKKVKNKSRVRYGEPKKLGHFIGSIGTLYFVRAEKTYGYSSRK